MARLPALTLTLRRTLESLTLVQAWAVNEVSGLRGGGEVVQVAPPP
jgi:hypothetical protein